MVSSARQDLAERGNHIVFWLFDWYNCFMEIIFGTFFFLFGTIIGSFLNVVAYRFNTGKTLGGRSMCFSCGKKLHWHELVPLVSFLNQNGRCLGCRTSISKQYPTVEALTGFLSAFLFIRFAYLLPESWLLFVVLFGFYFFLWSILMVIAIYDIRHMIIPDKLVYILTSFAFLSIFIFKGDALVFRIPEMIEIFSGLMIAFPFAALWYLSKGTMMGLGDGKLMIGIGYMLGLSQSVVGIMFAFWSGAIISVILLLIHGSKYKMKSQIPFGPFLIFGAFVAFIFELDLPLFLSYFVF
jgi:prepilin signal peptidase PulO-like enzyme (type II secretory pathway)